MGKESFYKKGYEVSVDNFPAEVSNLANLDVALSTLQRVRVYEQTFEDGTSDLTAYNCTQTVQSDEVYGGSYALKVTLAAGQTGHVTTPTRPVSAGQNVTFSFAHKEDANISDVKLIVIWRRSAGGIIDTEEYTLTPSDTWTVEHRTVTAPNKASTMELRMQATAGATEGNVYLDELTIDIVGQILRVDGNGRIVINLDEDSVGLAKEDKQILVDAERHGQIDVLTMPDVGIQPQGDIQPFSVSTTSNVKTPSSGKALQILAFFYYCDTDITTELRFKNSGNIIAGLPFKGAVAMNLVGVKPPQGSVDEPVEIYLSGTGNVKGWVCYKEV